MNSFRTKRENLELSKCSMRLWLAVTPDTSSMTIKKIIASASIGQMPSTEQMTPKTDDSATLCPMLTYFVEGNTLDIRAATLS